MTDSERKPLRAWLQLIRVPNLFTVPGDPIAGFMLASCAGTTITLSHLLPCVCTSLFLYAGGLISNDLFDIKCDREERPDRPLPSGRIKAKHAIVAAVVLNALGIYSASFVNMTTFVTALVLAILVLIYNSATKNIPLLGIITMGLCRGVSFMLGVAAAGESLLFIPALPVFIGITLYIAAVTAVAAHETKKQRISVRRLPWAILAAMFGALYYSLSHAGIAPNPTALLISVACAGAVICWTWMTGTSLKGEPEPEVTAKAIGKFIRALLLIQASIAALCPYPGILLAIALLATFPIASALARRFYSS
jgi:4-hydroxybenzoate polyprenyltransferase